MRKIVTIIVFLGIFQLKAALKDDESLKQLFVQLPSMQEERVK